MFKLLVDLVQTEHLFDVMLLVVSIAYAVGHRLTLPAADAYRSTNHNQEHDADAGGKDVAMNQFLAGMCIAILFAIAGEAIASETKRLDDTELDWVTAGATSGILVSAQGQTGGAVASSNSGLFNASGLIGARATALSDDGTAVAQLGGPVINVDLPNSSFSWAFLLGTTATTGDGQATVQGTAAATGDFTIADSLLLPLPSGRQVLGLAFGIGVDSPN